MVFTAALIGLNIYTVYKWIGELRRADYLQALVNSKYLETLGK